MSADTGVAGTMTADGTWMLECRDHGPLAVLWPSEPPDAAGDRARALEVGKTHLRTAHGIGSEHIEEKS